MLKPKNISNTFYFVKQKKNVKMYKNVKFKFIIKNNKIPVFTSNTYRFFTQKYRYFNI